MVQHADLDHAGLTGIPDLVAHLADASDAHDASAISVLDTATNFTGTDVEAVLAELQDNIDGVSGGGPPDCEEAYLGGDVTMVNADTWYDGPSMSLGAGDWEIEGQLTITDANSGVTGIVARLTDGSTHYSSKGSHKAAGAGLQHVVTVNARVTLGSTTTVKLQGSSARGTSSSVIKTTGVLTGEIANKATRIRAIAVTSI